jgi:hypothetical protein
MMRWESIAWLGAVLLLMALISGCQTPQSSTTADSSKVPPELIKPAFLFDVVRHLYRWHLDEAEIDRVIQEKQFLFWVHSPKPRLDPGDNSVFGEIFLPQLNLAVTVKKPDYTIEELHTAVQSPNFKITQVLRGDFAKPARQQCVITSVSTKEMTDYLFRTRNQREYPDAALLERMRQALRAEIAKDVVSITNVAPGEQIIHLAPLSPVANEAWVYWETGHKLLHFASDIDLANPAVWQNESMMVRSYDLDQQVVVSHHEAPGSNRFLTRYQVSRALFNCLVLGERILLTPGKELQKPR